MRYVRNGSKSHRGPSRLFRGLVLHLDPDVLRLEGAQCEGHGVRGDHYFLCVSADPESDESSWIPLSSKPGVGRLLVPACVKAGHCSWVRRPTYAVSHQLWLASSAAVFEAARVGLDQSRGGARNRVTENGLRTVLHHVA